MIGFSCSGLSVLYETAGPPAGPCPRPGLGTGGEIEPEEVDEQGPAKGLEDFPAFQ